MDRPVIYIYIACFLVLMICPFSCGVAETHEKQNEFVHTPLLLNSRQSDIDAYQSIKWELNPLQRERPKWSGRVHNYMAKMKKLRGFGSLPDQTITREKFSAYEEINIREKYFFSIGKDKLCLDSYAKAYFDRQITQCQQQGYAEHIAGGCYHVLKPFHTAVFKYALLNCNIEF